MLPELVQADLILKELKEHYYGFMYNPYMPKLKLFNPMGIQKYFSSNGVLSNYFIETGSTKMVIDLLKNIPTLEIKKELIYSIMDENFKISCSYGRVTNPQEWKEFIMDYKLILLCTGYLTWSDINHLKIPNKEIRNHLKEFLCDSFR